MKWLDRILRQKERQFDPVEFTVLLTLAAIAFALACVRFHEVYGG